LTGALGTPAAATGGVAGEAAGAGEASAPLNSLMMASEAPASFSFIKSSTLGFRVFLLARIDCRMVASGIFILTIWMSLATVMAGLACLAEDVDCAGAVCAR